MQYLFASGHYCRGREKDQGYVVCELFEKYFSICFVSPFSSINYWIFCFGKDNHHQFTVHCFAIKLLLLLLLNQYFREKTFCYFYKKSCIGSSCQNSSTTSKASLVNKKKEKLAYIFLVRHFANGSLVMAHNCPIKCITKSMHYRFNFSSRWQQLLALHCFEGVTLIWSGGKMARHTQQKLNCRSLYIWRADVHVKPKNDIFSPIFGSFSAI